MKRVAELVAVSEQLREDAELDPEQLMRRDREIGRQVAAGANEVQYLGQWLRSLGAHRRRSIAASEVRLRMLGAICFVLGVVTSWGAATVVLAYDGEHPVNVINAFAVLVVAQVALLPLFLIAALPVRSDRSSWFSELRDMIDLSAAYRFVARRLPVARGVGAIFKGDAGGRVAKWVSLSWSQMFAVGFNLGALAACLSLIVFSDLAFVWSTTLDVDSRSVQRLTDALCWPWATVWPAAVPSAELIDSSQYFRLQSDRSARLTDAKALTGWWPFLLASIVSYGAVPRLLTLAFCRNRLRSCATRAMLDMPGVRELLERMVQPDIETRADEADSVEDAAEAVLRHDASMIPAFGADSALLIVWGDLPATDEVLSARFESVCGLQVANLLRAGRFASLAEERAALDRVVGESAESELVILVKAWEPPLLELLDFLRELRSRAGPERAIAVIPCDLDDRGRLTSAQPVQIDTWHTRIAGLGDARTFVRPFGGD